MTDIRHFDRNEILNRAMKLFWVRGYEATSIRDLVETLGISRGSIYTTFGDKEGVFIAAIDHYLETVAKNLVAELSDPDPRRAIERMFDSIVQRTSDPRLPRGCLIVNTSLECPTSGDAITRKVAEAFGRQESAIYRVLLRAQAEGSLARTVDARALARFFLGVAQGLNVINKALADPETLKDIARTAMKVWDEAGATSAGRIQTRSRRELTPSALRRSESNKKIGE